MMMAAVHVQRLELLGRRMDVHQRRHVNGKLA